MSGIATAIRGLWWMEMTNSCFKGLTRSLVFAVYIYNNYNGTLYIYHQATLTTICLLCHIYHVKLHRKHNV